MENALKLAHLCVELLALAARKLEHGLPASALLPRPALPSPPSTRAVAGGAHASSEIPPSYHADGAVGQPSLTTCAKSRAEARSRSSGATRRGKARAARSSCTLRDYFGHSARELQPGRETGALQGPATTKSRRGAAARRRKRALELGGQAPPGNLQAGEAQKLLLPYPQSRRSETSPITPRSRQREGDAAGKLAVTPSASELHWGSRAPTAMSAGLS